MMALVLGFLQLCIKLTILSAAMGGWPELLKACQLDGQPVQVMGTTFFLSRETIIPSKRPGMAIWREHLFAILSRNAQSATAFFHLPANRVVELGMQVEV